MSDPLRVMAETAISLYRELREDWVEVWVIPGRVRYLVPDVSDERCQAISEAILRALVANGVQLGSWEANSALTPWPADGAVDRVMREWRALGRDPDIGEIGWLVLKADSVEKPGDGAK